MSFAFYSVKHVEVRGRNQKFRLPYSCPRSGRLTLYHCYTLMYAKCIVLYTGDDALSNIYIYIYDTPEQEHLCTHFPGPATPGEPLVLNCTKPITGISVKVLKRKDPIMVLSVLSACEIEVHALGSNGKFQHFVCLT